MKAGYYTNERDQTHFALRYVPGSEELEMFYDENRIVTGCKKGDSQFTLPQGKRKFVFASTPAGNITRKPTTGNGKPIEFKYVCGWPVEEEIDSHGISIPRINSLDYKESELISSMRTNGFVVLQNMYEQELLQSVLKFFENEQQRKNKRGWYALNLNYDTNEKLNESVNALQQPLVKFLNLFLGEGKWKDDSKIQVAFSVQSRTAEAPTYHIDKMFLEKGEPFSILVGIPLMGEMDKDLSGNLSVLPGSHEIIQSHIQEHKRIVNDNIILNSTIDKNVKLKKVLGLESEESLKFRCVRAIPGEAFLCHYRLVHGVEKNFRSPRAIAYMRIKVNNDVREAKGVPHIPNWIDSVASYGAWDLWELPTNNH